jgi:ERCC4-type nuclease
MILVDRRVGSKELAVPLEKAGLPVFRNKDKSLPELDFGDVAFSGRGTKGSSVDISIELKTLTDFVGSVRSGRLAGHQLPGLRAAYDHAWLVIEGRWHTDDKGNVVTWQGQSRGLRPLPGNMSASELEKHVLTFELCGGLHTRYTNSRQDTVRFIANLYRWWTDQALDHHTSHMAVHDQPTLVPISPWRHAFCKLPGIGVKSSKAVAEHFENSLARAACAGVTEWSNIEVHDESTGKTRRLGVSTAERITRFMSGKK